MAKNRFKNWKPPVIRELKLTKWQWLVQYAKNLKLGWETDIGAFCYINAKGGVTIGDYVEIGSHSALHSYSSIDGKMGPIVLGKNCKIGSHTVILPGVTIGENSKIGAQSLVTGDIPSNVVAFGCPAKVIRKLREDELGD